MITNISHTKNWIESLRKIPEYNKTDPALIEKMIMAFTLLEFLALNKLKKANKPAFYYWYKCLEEINQLQ